MTSSKTETEILRYLIETTNIKDLEFEAVLNTESDGKYLVTPWESQQICHNTDHVNMDEVLRFASRFNEMFKTFQMNFHGKTIFRLIANDSPPKLISEVKLLPISTKNLTVRDAFDLLLYLRINSMSGNGSTWVRKEDAIFSIKNEVMLPDDFVPAEWMLIVENDQNVVTEESLNRLGKFNDHRLIYIFSSYDGQSPIMPYLFFPRQSVKFQDNVTESLIISAITESFKELQASEKFSDFTLSRLLKTVVFNIETKNNRELKKPVFDKNRVNLLEKLDIVGSNNEKSWIRDDIGLDEIRRLYQVVKSSAASIADRWMNSQISIDISES